MKSCLVCPFPLLTMASTMYFQQPSYNDFTSAQYRTRPAGPSYGSYAGYANDWDFFGGARHRASSPHSPHAVFHDRSYAASPSELTASPLSSPYSPRLQPNVPFAQHDASTGYSGFVPAEHSGWSGASTRDIPRQQGRGVRGHAAEYYQQQQPFEGVPCFLV